MKERLKKTKQTPLKVDLRCSDQFCFGVMVYQAPAKDGGHRHRCDTCQRQEAVSERFPRMEFVDA